MIDIYAIGTREANGNISDHKVLIQQIPAGSEKGIKLLAPIVKNEMGNADSMDFNLQPGSEFYDVFVQFLTYILVEYQGETIFYGRVLTINNGFFGEQKIHCEGALAFLNDTYYPSRSSSEKEEKTILQELTDILDNHNYYADDPRKKIYLGEVPGNYNTNGNRTNSEQQIENKSREFGSSSWTSSKSAIEDLKSHYGGSFRIRYEGGYCYLDWVNHYYRNKVNTQTIEVGKNLIDISNSTEVSNIFTAIIPIGKESSGSNSIYITGYRNETHGNGAWLAVPDIVHFYTDSELRSGYHEPDDYKIAVDTYGWIYKTVSFDDAHSQEDLLSKAAEWIKDNYQGGVTTFTVKALDMRLVGEDAQKIMVGDRVTLKYPIGLQSGGSKIVPITRTCTSVQYDLYNPENNQYTFGIPANALSKNYGDDSEKQKKRSSSASPKDDGGGENKGDQMTRWVNEVRNYLRNKLKVWKNSNDGVPAGPTNTVFDGSQLHGYYLQSINSLDNTGRSRFILITPGSWTIEKGYKDGNYRSWYEFTKHSETGRTVVVPVTLTNEQATTNKLVEVMEKYKVFDLVYYEWGINLRDKSGNYLINTMPSVTMDSEGNVTWHSDDPEYTGEGLVKKVMEYSANNGRFNFFGTDGETIFSWIDPYGGMHYYKKDPNNPNELLLDKNGNPIELTFESIDADVHTVNAKLSDAELLLAEHGRTISKNSSDIIIMGGDLTRAQIQIAADGRTLMAINQQVTDITSQQVTIRSELNEAENELIKQDRSITKIGSDVTEINAGLTRAEAELVSQGQKITKVGSDVIILGGNLTEAQRQIAANGDSILAVNQKVTDINSRLVTIRSQLNDAESELYKQGKSITKISGDVMLLNAGLTQAEADLVAQGKKITKVGDDIVVIGGVMNEAQRQIAANGDSIMAINQTVTDITSRQVTIQSQLSAAEQKLRDQGSSITKIGGDIVIIGGDLTEAQRKIAENKDSIFAINQKVTDITSNQVTIRSTLTDLEDDLVDKGKTISKIEGDITLINSNLSSAEAELVRQGNSITKIGSDITVIGGSLTEAQRQVAANKQSITAINSDVTDINSEVTNIHGQLNVASARIDNLESDTIKTGDLSAKIGAINGLTVQNLTTAEFGYIMSPVYYIGTPGNAKAVDNMIVSASVDQATNTLTLTPLSGAPITFKKAASINNLAGEWGGANNYFPLRVLSDPDLGKYYRIGFSESGAYETNLILDTNGESEAISGSPNRVLAKLKVATYQNGSPPTITTRYTKDISIDATPAYENGRNAVSLESDFTFSPNVKVTGSETDPSSNQTTISISTTGKDTNDKTSKDIYIDSGSWNGNSRTIYLKRAVGSDTYKLAKSTISGPTITANWAKPSSMSTYSNQYIVKRGGTAISGLDVTIISDYEISSDGKSYNVQAKTSSGDLIYQKNSGNDAYNNGRNAVSIESDFTFSPNVKVTGSETDPSNNQTTVSISTTGKDTNATTSKNIYLESTNWSGNSKTVYLKRAVGSDIYKLAKLGIAGPTITADWSKPESTSTYSNKYVVKRDGTAISGLDVTIISDYEISSDGKSYNVQAKTSGGTLIYQKNTGTEAYNDGYDTAIGTSTSHPNIIISDLPDTITYGDELTFNVKVKDRDGNAEYYASKSYTIPANNSAAYSVTACSATNISITGGVSGYDKKTTSGYAYYTKNGTSGSGTVIRFYVSPKLIVDGQQLSYSGSDYPFYETLPTDIYKLGFDADHDMFVSSSGSDDPLSTLSVSPGDSGSYYPTFKKSDGTTYQYGSPIAITGKTDNFLTPENIKSGVKIYNVTGSYNPAIGTITGVSGSNLADSNNYAVISNKLSGGGYTSVSSVTVTAVGNACTSKAMALAVYETPQVHDYSNGSNGLGVLVYLNNTMYIRHRLTNVPSTITGTIKQNSYGGSSYPYIVEASGPNGRCSGKVTVYLKNSSGTVVNETDVSINDAVTGAYRAGYADGKGDATGGTTIKRPYKIELDGFPAGPNYQYVNYHRSGSWWNFYAYYQGSSAEHQSTDGSSVGLYMKTGEQVELTSNGIHNAYEHGYAVFASVKVNVPSGSSRKRVSTTTFHCSVDTAGSTTGYIKYTLTASIKGGTGVITDGGDYVLYI